MSSSVNNNNSQLEWRRNKVLELSSQGHNQPEISKILHISQPTINRDISYLRKQAKDKIKEYIDEKLPEEYEKCLVGITAIMKEAWITSQNTEDNEKREKIAALQFAKECYTMKLDLLTNATVVDDAIKFVNNEKNKNNGNKNEKNQQEQEDQRLQSRNRYNYNE